MAGGCSGTGDADGEHQRGVLIGGGTVPMSEPDVGDLPVGARAAGPGVGEVPVPGGWVVPVARAAAGWQGATPAAPGADEAAGPILAG